MVDFLSHINELGTLGIAQCNAIERADYGYYKQAKYLTASNNLSVDDFKIFRGNKSHNILSVTEEKHIHTTDMSNTPKKLKLPLHYIGSAKTAKEGDIIIARVGRRCLGRVALVTEGEAPVSDCVIVVTPKNKTIREQIWTMLSSQRCHDYLISASLGVGAKYITYKTIMDYLTNENASA